MNQIILNLYYLRQSIRNGETQNIDILNLVAARTYKTALEADFEYVASYSNENCKVHFHYYSQLAKKAKAKLLTNLQELNMELAVKNIRSGRCLFLIENLLKSNLYQNDVNTTINRWENITKKELKYEVISVK